MYVPRLSAGISVSVVGFAVQPCSLIGSQKQQLSKVISLVLVSFVTTGLQFMTMVKIAHIRDKSSFIVKKKPDHILFTCL